MGDTTAKKLQYFFLVCNRKSMNRFTDLLCEHGGQSIDAVYGKGSANAGSLARAFGFEIEEKKAVITCLLPHDKAEALIELLCREYKFDQSNTGIAFSIPVDRLAF